MVTLRITQKLQKFLNVELSQQLVPSTNKLGDWFANLIPTFAGDLVIFVNEKTFLPVAIPAWEIDQLYNLLPLRIINLLGMIGISPVAAGYELIHYDQFQFTKTNSRVILGIMNDFAYQFQAYAELAKKEEDYSLSRAEYRISETPCKPFKYKSPQDVAKELLSGSNRSSVVQEK